ncbi:MAG TPA: glycosyltransferase family 2 protein, partial [Mycobacteriales bacterium]|nr:glycosyltransferase family 2 protein [Mycobacteriales bacterium]
MSSRQALISVISPCYNAEAFVGSMLESLIAQSFDLWECVVVDDGSTDRSADIVAEFVKLDSRIRLVRAERRGPSAARNIGFMESSTETSFVTFMDADDEYEPGALADLTEAASR